MDDQERQRGLDKLAAAAEHTAEQADLAEAAVPAAEEKLDKARQRVKDAEAALAEAKRTAKDARSTARDFTKQHQAAVKDGGHSGTRAQAGAATGAGGVN